MAKIWKIQMVKMSVQIQLRKENKRLAQQIGMTGKKIRRYLKQITHKDKSKKHIKIQ